MAKTVTTMPSSIITSSTEHDSMTSPDGHGHAGGGNPESPTTSHSSPAASPRDRRNGFDKLSPHAQPQYLVKRKRSTSMDDGELSPRQYDYSPPKRNEHPQQMAGQALHMLGNAQPPSAHSYYPSGNEGRSSYWSQERANSENHTAQPSEDRNTSPPNESRENSQSYATPPPGSVTGHITDSNGTPPARPGGPVVQVGKRKRNFSNRTKTGCMTCRQRKKKCDEGRPYCHNCQRGGFQCQGYTVVRGVWPKNNGSKGPVPLQSKEGQQGSMDATYKNDAEPTSAHPSHQGAGPQHSAQHDASGDPGHAQYAQNPESRGRPSYSGQTWPPQQGHPQPYTSEHLPSLSEIARSDANKQDYPSAPPPPRDMSRPPTQSIPPSVPPAPNPQSGHWPPPAQTEYRSAYHPPRLETHHNPPPLRAPTSAYEYPKSGAKTFTVEEVERSRMLRHTRFNYFDPTLKNERQRCAEALARYNKACMLRSGVTEHEAQTMLMKVFDPSLDTTHRAVAACKEKGVLGPGVKIEGPFKCTYGYNLRIMDNVFIGENTRIDDSARVDIGARTWIGPNVTILTTDVSKDMVDRKGTESTCYAAPVTIHSEVVIGSNAVIYPGVTLHRGSTVEPFALVRDNLGENQIQKAAVGPRAT